MGNCWCLYLVHGGPRTPNPQHGQDCQLGKILDLAKEKGKEKQGGAKASPIRTFSLLSSLMEAPCWVPMSPFDICQGTLELSVLVPPPTPTPSALWQLAQLCAQAPPKAVCLN